MKNPHLAAVAIASVILSGCATFKASDANTTGEPNWKPATLLVARANVAYNKDCVYTVDETHKKYQVGNRQACLEHIEIDVNSYKLTVVGVPILMGGIQENFNYRPAMQ